LIGLTEIDSTSINGGTDLRNWFFNGLRDLTRFYVRAGRVGTWLCIFTRLDVKHFHGSLAVRTDRSSQYSHKFFYLGNCRFSLVPPSSSCRSSNSDMLIVRYLLSSSLEINLICDLCFKRSWIKGRNTRTPHTYLYVHARRAQFLKKTWNYLCNLLYKLLYTFYVSFYWKWMDLSKDKSSNSISKIFSLLLSLLRTRIF